MSSEELWTVEIREARLGSEESVNWLAGHAEERVRAYIFRVTLDGDLTDDLTQDTLFQMIRSIRQLKDEENFWPWLYRVAQSKIQEHYRSKKKEQLVSEDSFYDNILSHRGDLYQDESLRSLIQRDLLKKVMVAMKQLKSRHRAILSLRCFDNLSYAEIADSLDCNEMTARLLFYRARKALRKRLSNQGISKNLMLTSLGLFGRLTLSPDASSSVPSGPVSKASVQVGPAATILGSIVSRNTALLAVAAAILLMLLSERGHLPVPPSVSPPASSVLLPARNEISSLHFTVQVLDSDPNAEGSLSKGAYERWFYFPEGIDGPAFMRMQRYTADLSQKLCAWLENDEANYYYNSDYSIVHVTNSRVCWSNLKVRRLPTDSQEFIDFLREAEGEPPVFRQYSRDKKTGLMTNSVDLRFLNASSYRTDYEFNTVPREEFQYKWDEPVKGFVDERDRMHKRGWTYFTIEGQFSGKKISGRGRVPFVYRTCRDYSAWLVVNVADELEIADCNRGAFIYRLDDGDFELYPSGAFFRGLSRPWMGLHTMDSVRRDAAGQAVLFFTELSEDKSDAIITLYQPETQDKIDVVYVVDVENDIVEKIVFAIGPDVIGSLEFSYLQDVDATGSAFTEPVMPINAYSGLQRQAGILWPVELAHGRLDK